MINSIGLNGSLLMGAQALSSQQQAIETIGNNISNVNTVGYARQRANLVENVQNGVGGEIDGGVNVSSIESLRSTMLDSLVQQSLGAQGYADNQANLTSTVQDALGEQFGATGSTSAGTVASASGPIQGALTTFFAALQSLAATPSDPPARQVVVQDAQNLSNTINGAYQRLQATQGQVATDATSVASQINQLSSSIAKLNQQIIQTQAASGQPANGLVNSREAQIEQLAQLVNINTSQQSDGTVNISLADNSNVVLVHGVDGAGAGTSQSLSVTYNASASTPLTVSASSTGALGTGIPSGGSLGSDLDVANNVIGAPGGSGLLGSLDAVANNLRTAVNTQNAAGFDLNGNAGGNIFTGTGAADLAVTSAVAGNPALLAAGNGSGPLDGSNAQAMANLQNNTGIIPAFQGMVANLGQTVATAAGNQATQDQVTQVVQKQRDSVSGVSIDEEMTNLINFQQAYSASARFIDTISNMYDTLINKTG